MNLQKLIESWKKYRLQRKEEQLEDYARLPTEQQAGIDFSNKRLLRLHQSYNVPIEKVREVLAKSIKKQKKRGIKIKDSSLDPAIDAFARRTFAMWGSTDLPERRKDQLNKLKAMKKRKK
jgi:hypothetical protein